MEVSSTRKITIPNWSPPSAGGGLEITIADGVETSKAAGRLKGPEGCVG